MKGFQPIGSSFEFDGMKFVVFPNVYNPAEDSFLLAKHAKKARGRVLDVGTGCGIQAITSNASEVVGIDINPHAIKNAQYNARLNNKANCVFFESDLFEKVEGKFDFILFNPPYLPTSKNEKTKNKNLENAWDGGKDGRVILDRFLNEFENFLKPKGKLLLLHSSYANTSKTINLLESRGFIARVLEKARFPFFEELSVLEAVRRAGFYSTICTTNKHERRS